MSVTKTWKKKIHIPKNIMINLNPSYLTKYIAQEK